VGTGKRERQVAGSAADIEHARFGPVQDVPHATNRVGAPVTVDIEGKQMIGHVVAVCHAAEHVAHPESGLPLIARAFRSRTLHERANLMASSTSGSSIPLTTSAAPMRTGSTKWTLPRTVFLSCTRRASKRSAAIPSSDRIGP